MTELIVAVFPRINNPKPVFRALFLRTILWLLSHYAKDGFYLSVDSGEKYSYIHGQKQNYPPLPPLNAEQKNTLRQKLERLARGL